MTTTSAMLMLNPYQTAPPPLVMTRKDYLARFNCSMPLPITRTWVNNAQQPLPGLQFKDVTAGNLPMRMGDAFLEIVMTVREAINNGALGAVANGQGLSFPNNFYGHMFENLRLHCNGVQFGSSKGLHNEIVTDVYSALDLPSTSEGCTTFGYAPNHGSMDALANNPGFVARNAMIIGANYPRVAFRVPLRLLFRQLMDWDKATVGVNWQVDFDIRPLWQWVCGLNAIGAPNITDIEVVINELTLQVPVMDPSSLIDPIIVRNMQAQTEGIVSYKDVKVIETLIGAAATSAQFNDTVLGKPNFLAFAFRPQAQAAFNDLKDAYGPPLNVNSELAFTIQLNTVLIAEQLQTLFSRVPGSFNVTRAYEEYLKLCVDESCPQMTLDEFRLAPILFADLRGYNFEAPVGGNAYQLTVNLTINGAAFGAVYNMYTMIEYDKKMVVRSDGQRLQITTDV